MAATTPLLPVRILGTGEHVPGNRVTSQALDQRWGKPEGWTARHSGIRHRNFAGDGETTSSMAASAATAALSAAGMDAAELDCIVCACSVAEQAIPCTAVLVQRRLGLQDSGIAAFDVNATCLSFLAAWDMLAAAITVGRYRRVLLVSSEVASAGLPWHDPATAMLFGDGAGAVVLGRAGEGDDSGVLASHFQTFSAGAELCQVRSGGTRVRPADGMAAFLEGACFEMRGPATYRMAAQRLPAFLQQLFERANVALERLACIVPHQASAKGLAHLEAALRLPADLLVRILPERGNQLAASIPIALHHAIAGGRLKRGQLLALVGSGAGLSFGGTVLRY